MGWIELSLIAAVVLAVALIARLLFWILRRK
jgi:hypothetical protein